MFWSKNKKNTIYPCIPQLYYIKVGFEGVYFTRTCFPDGNETNGWDSENIDQLTNATEPYGQGK